MHKHRANPRLLRVNDLLEQVRCSPNVRAIVQSLLPVQEHQLRQVRGVHPCGNLPALLAYGLLLQHRYASAVPRPLLLSSSAQYRKGLPTPVAQVLYRVGCLLRNKYSRQQGEACWCHSGEVH